MPQAVVTSGVVEWNGRIVIASGEVSPGVRTPAVRAVEPASVRAGFGLLNTIVLAVYLLFVFVPGASLWLPRLLS